MPGTSAGMQRLAALLVFLPDDSACYGRAIDSQAGHVISIAGLDDVQGACPCTCPVDGSVAHFQLLLRHAHTGQELHCPHVERSGGTLACLVSEAGDVKFQAARAYSGEKARRWVRKYFRSLYARLGEGVEDAVACLGQLWLAPGVLGPRGEPAEHALATEHCCPPRRAQRADAALRASEPAAQCLAELLPSDMEGMGSAFILTDAGMTTDDAVRPTPSVPVQPMLEELPAGMAPAQCVHNTGWVGYKRTRPASPDP